MESANAELDEVQVGVAPGPNKDLIEEDVLWAGAPSYFTSCPRPSLDFKHLFSLYLHPIYSNLGDPLIGS